MAPALCTAPWPIYGKLSGADAPRPIIERTINELPSCPFDEAVVDRYLQQLPPRMAKF